MFSKSLLLSGLILAWLSTDALAYKQAQFSQKLCEKSSMSCYRVKNGDSWGRLFPNAEQRDLVMRLNRMNVRLRSGMLIAIPKQLDQFNLIDIAPFSPKIPAPGQRKIVVDLNKLAWGAYDAKGHLIHWGPASGGKGWCPDVNRACRTMTGNYRVYRKQGAACVSSVFPVEWSGGAAMPFCMHYHRGFALHGSYQVPGYNASHGCVRMFISDARWLNNNFADYGTKVEVKKYAVYQ